MKKRESEEGKFARKAGVFLLHDATIKDRASVLQTAARCELRDPESGEITIANCPIKRRTAGWRAALRGFSKC